MKNVFLNMIEAIKILLFTVIFISFSSIAQKTTPFIGMIEYKISAHDSTLIDFLPNYPMIIYTNDTITRTENYTDQLGKQIQIYHMRLNKSYILLDTPKGKFAIQNDLNKLPKDSVPTKYTFKKKLFKKKILGRKANRMIVNHPSFKEPIEFLYFKNKSPDCNPIFKEIPGLLVKYSISTIDGVLDYEMVRFNEYTPNNDLFGIPSDFKRISFSDFVELMTTQNNN